MNYRSTLVGAPPMPSARVVVVIVLAAILSFGWVYLLDALEAYVPGQLSFAWVGVPTVVLVGVCTYKMRGVLVGWLIGAGAFFTPLVFLSRSMMQKTGEGTVLDAVLGGVLWSLLFSFVFFVVGLVLGVGLRFGSSGGTWLGRFRGAR